MGIPDGWTGGCGPLVYLGQCKPKDIEAYVLYSRFWLTANSVAFLMLLVAFIRRCVVVTERFNTLRLLMIKFLIGLAMNITYDILRSANATSFGASPSFIGCLWVTSWVGPLGALVLLTITWMSFSNKNLLARPVITGNWPLYLAFMIPFTVTTIVLGAVSGISYKVYLVAMRACMAAWATMLLILFAMCLYHGRRTWVQLKVAEDKFVVKQHVRAYIVISLTLLSSSFMLIMNGTFLIQIDTVRWRYLLVLSVYRVNAIFIYVCCAIYVWIATTRWKENPHTRRTRSTTSSKQNHDSHAASSRAQQSTPRIGETSSSSTDDDPDSAGETNKIPEDPDNVKTADPRSPRPPDSQEDSAKRSKREKHRHVVVVVDTEEIAREQNDSEEDTPEEVEEDTANSSHV